MTSQAAIQRKARELLQAAEEAKARERQRQDDAWRSAAAAWRHKHAPSQAEVAAARQAERRAAAKPRMPTHVTAGAYADAMAGGAPLPDPPGRGASRRRGAAGEGSAAAAAGPAKPPADAPEADWRAYHRHAAQARVVGAAGFEAVLLAFRVPCDPGRLREAYRQVRARREGEGLQRGEGLAGGGVAWVGGPAGRGACVVAALGPLRAPLAPSAGHAHVPPRLQLQGPTVAHTLG